jgi:hypothetical protein
MILIKPHKIFMNIVEIRQQIKEYVDQLSPDKLLVAADFLAYLAEKDDDENQATEELLKIQGFKEAFAKAKKNVEEGKVISVEQHLKYVPKKPIYLQLLR